MNKKGLIVKGYKIRFRANKVVCNRGFCNKCPHGPYWYGYFTYNGRDESFYIGKKFEIDIIKKKFNKRLKKLKKRSKV